MTHGQCQNAGTCVPVELSSDKTPAEEKGTEALWDKSRVKDGANVDRLLVHILYIHTHLSSGINLLTKPATTPANSMIVAEVFFSCVSYL